MYEEKEQEKKKEMNDISNSGEFGWSPLNNELIT